MGPDQAGLQDSPIGRDAAAALIRGRRSVDRFRAGECPDPSLIQEAIEVARWAPNHHLTEPWRFYLIGPHTQSAIVELNASMVAARRGAEAADAKRQRWQAVPGWLAVGCRADPDDPVTAREDYAACACAVQNLMLYLHSAGVATKWTSGPVTRAPEFLELLGAGPGESCVALIWYGYAQRRPRSRRRPVSSLVRALD